MMVMVEVSPMTSTHDLTRTKSYKSLFRKWFSCNSRIPSHNHHQVSAVDERTIEETSTTTTSNVSIPKYKYFDPKFVRSVNEVAVPRYYKHRSLDKGDDLVHDNASAPKRARRIVYSHSSGLLKPPASEQHLQCTLHDLCFGCKKIINITRCSSTHSRGIVEEEEAITINVKPGWREGTKIKFEGKADFTLGAYQQDVIFYISEKRHEFFAREGDDLELSLEISLVNALTGSVVSVPLLGGEHMDLKLDDQIVYPGFQKIVTGLGMPMSHDPEKRGNLIITFHVRFPTQLTHDQRSQVVNILQRSR